MSAIKFKIAAKTDVGRVRKNNEDNLQAACDLTTAPMKWVNDMECNLGNKGALLVVADGMGGMNAGEVASEIAINTVKEFFSPEKITADVLGSKVGIETFMKKSITEADKRIKADAKANPEHKGMGTTIVIGWLLNDTLYVAWCGDSRAYIYNRVNGLRQISKDHSYVQTLVDKGKITHEEAFDYPDSNIITRCLSDSEQKARPDTLAHPIAIHNGDIILLCTDGLSGMIRDHEIEQILAENEHNLSVCTDKLIEAACEASGQDNITVALCQITSGALEPQKAIRKNRLSNTLSFNKKEPITIKKGLIGKFVAILFVLVLVFGSGFWFGRKGNTVLQTENNQDSTMLSINKNEYNDTISLLYSYRKKADSLGRVLLASNDTIKRLRKDLISKEKEVHDYWVKYINTKADTIIREPEKPKQKNEKGGNDNDKKNNDRKR